MVTNLKVSLKPLGVGDINGDRGVEDFRKWIINFAENESGHFTSVGAAEDFARQALAYIKVDGYIGEVSDANKPKRVRG